MDLARQESSSKQRFQNLIDLSVKGRYCPYTDLNWEEHPSEDVPWMPFEMCSIYHTKMWSTLTDRQKLRLTQLELINIFSITLAGEQEIQRDLMPLLFSKTYEQESAYLSTLLREEYDHATMFWRFCKTYRGDIYRTKHFRMHRWEDPLQVELNGFVQTLIAEMALTYFNEKLSRAADIPELIRQINKRHHSDEARHIVMGRQMVDDLWGQFKKERPLESVNNYRIYVGKFIRFFMASLANVDVYREIEIKDPMSCRLEFERYLAVNIAEFSPVKRLLDFLRKIEMQ